MKKIKGILLFGILILLGIGSSFSQFIDLRDNTGSQLLIPDLKYKSINPRYSFSFQLGNSLYLTGRIVPKLDFVDIVACYDSNRNIKGFRGSVWDSFSFGNTGDCQYADNYSIISSHTGTSGLNILNYLYIRNDVPISPYSDKSLGSIDRYLYFDFYKYYTYNGNFSDVPSGYVRDKVFLSLAGNYGIVNRNLNDGSYLFTSLFDDSFFIGNEFVNVGFLLLHLGGYDTEYYNGGGTLLLALGDDTGTNSGSNSIIFNYYTGFYIDYSEIQNVSPSLKGYITSGGSVSDGFNKFMSLLTGQKYSFVLTEGNVPNNYLKFISYPYQIINSSQGTGIYNFTSTYLFDFTIYDQVPDFIENSPGTITNQTISDSLYYYCKGPNYDTPDGLPPAFCFNSNGELDYQRFENCFFTYDVNNDVYHQYCYLNGFQQEVVMVEDGSGYSIALGTTYPELDNLGMTGYSEDYFENVLNKTGRFFKCPRVYDNKLTLWPNVMNLLNGFDILLPFNCGLAGFTQGKHLVSFGSGSRILESPLLNFEGENRKALYLFFDILISIGIILFVGKIFYLFHK